MLSFLALAAVAPAFGQAAVVSPVTGVQTNQVLVDFTPGEVKCDGPSVRAVALAQPVPAATTLPPGQVPAAFTFSFRIDENGRALSIKAEPGRTGGLYFAATDLQPALAASRFQPEEARAHCTIQYIPVVAPIGDASMDRVYRYLALPHERSYFEQALAKRARDASPDCFGDKPPAMLQQGYPDFDRVPQSRGALSATVVSYDIDASGKPVRIRTLVSDGNAALDAAGREAVGRSRYTAGARTGCTIPFYRRQSMPLAPPKGPSAAEFRAADSDCENQDGAWSLPPRLIFPEPFRRRAIEGWAMIRYDVAPWGQTGNVTVLASEPAAMFGDQAKQIIMAAKRPESSRGATGCVERVVFKLPESGSGEDPILPLAPAPIVD